MDPGELRAIAAARDVPLAGDVDPRQSIAWLRRCWKLDTLRNRAVAMLTYHRGSRVAHLSGHQRSTLQSICSLGRI